MSTLGYALSALVGLILVFTGVLKLREGRKLGETIARYRVLPPSMVRLTASFLPPIELAVGLCLVLGIAGPWPFAAAGLIVIYTSAVISVIARKISTDCGCFGSVLRSQANGVVVGRNVVMMLALLPSILLPPAALIEGWVGWCLVGVATLAGLTRALSRTSTRQRKTLHCPQLASDDTVLRTATTTFTVSEDGRNMNLDSMGVDARSAMTSRAKFDARVAATAKACPPGKHSCRTCSDLNTAAVLTCCGGCAWAGGNPIALLSCAIIMCSLCASQNCRRWTYACCGV